VKLLRCFADEDKQVIRHLTREERIEIVIKKTEDEIALVKQGA
jgi:hypothetical protein